MTRASVTEKNCFQIICVIFSGLVVPVKASIGNDFPRKVRENSQNLLPVLVLNLGDASARQYCTGHFYCA